VTAAEKPLVWRVLGANDRGEYARLVDRAFGLAAPETLFSDFPVWDPEIVPSPNRHQVGGFQGTRLVATASLRMVDYLFLDGFSAKFGLVGAVATHPDFSGRGYAGEALALIIREGERRGANAFALWGSEISLYRNLSFEFAGDQLRAPIRSLRLPKTVVTGYDFRTGWDSTIAEHLLSRKSGVRYSDADILWLSRHPRIEWRTLWIDGKCLAYAGWNRGIDLPNIIHELDGDPGVCLTLLRLLQERYPSLEWIAHPGLLANWGIGGTESATREKLAQFRLRDLPRERLGSIWFSGMDSC